MNAPSQPQSVHPFPSPPFDQDYEVLLKRFEEPDETRFFPKGRFDVVRLGSQNVARATYQPGWKWSVDVGAALGLSFCPVEHTGIALAGSAAVVLNTSNVVLLRAGDLFAIPPGHDSWVNGDEPYISLHFEGLANLDARHAIPPKP